VEAKVTLNQIVGKSVPDTATGREPRGCSKGQLPHQSLRTRDLAYKDLPPKSGQILKSPRRMTAENTSKTTDKG